VFVDSPLGLKITRIYSALQPFWDNESRQLLKNGDHPFDFEHLYAISRYKEHKVLLDIQGSAIIIAGSGMCTGGRIIEHLEIGLEQAENDIFFIGYQVRGTPGYDIIKYAQQPGGYVWLKNEKVSVRAHVEQLSGYSAHADRSGLLHWVNSMPEKPGKIKLVHGDDRARHVLGAELKRQGYSLADC
jgi:metallo-beta-lactamase family protein